MIYRSEFILKNSSVVIIVASWKGYGADVGEMPK